MSEKKIASTSSAGNKTSMLPMRVKMALEKSLEQGLSDGHLTFSEE